MAVWLPWRQAIIIIIIIIIITIIIIIIIIIMSSSIISIIRWPQLASVATFVLIHVISGCFYYFMFMPLLYFIICWLSYGRFP